MGALVGRARRSAERRPEWWTLVLAAVAWVALLWPAVPGGGAAGHHHGSHSVAGSDLGTLSLSLGHWLLMVVAMMLPLVVPSVRFVAFRSFRRRRHRAVALFLLGYLAVWTALGLLVCAALVTLPALAGSWRGEAAALAFLAAAAWQTTTWHRRALVSCHWTMPLAPSGLRADRDAVLFGWRIGGSCCRACWAVMVACTVTGHAPVALVAGAAIGLHERTAWRPSRRWVGAALVVLAVGSAGWA